MRDTRPTGRRNLFTLDAPLLPKKSIRMPDPFNANHHLTRTPRVIHGSDWPARADAPASQDLTARSSAILMLPRTAENSGLLLIAPGGDSHGLVEHVGKVALTGEAQRFGDLQNGQPLRSEQQPGFFDTLVQNVSVRRGAQGVSKRKASGESFPGLSRQTGPPRLSRSGRHGTVISHIAGGYGFWP